MALITEDHLEQQSLVWFRKMGYTVVHGPQLAPDGQSRSGRRSAKWCSRGVFTQH